VPAARENLAHLPIDSPERKRLPPLLRRALRSLELEEQRHPLKTAALAASDAPIPNAAVMF